MFGKHQTELAGRLAHERGRGWSQGGPPDKWVDGVLTEVGSTALEVGGEHSEHSNAEKKS